MSDFDTGAAAAAANEPIGQQATAIADTIDDSDLNLDFGDDGDEPQQRQDVKDEGPAAPEKPQRAPVDDGREPEEAEEEVTEPEGKAEGAEEPPAEDDEDAKAREAAAEDAKTVKIDGREIPIAEIKRGFLRQQDYTRKTQELAQVRGGLEQHAQRLQSSEAELGKILDIAVNLVKARMPQPPDRAMIDSDPVGYLHHQEAYRAAMVEVDQIMQAQAQVGKRSQAQTEAQQRQSEEQFQQALAAEAEAMRTKLPELLDPEKRQQFVSKATKIGDRYGLKEADILGIQDHRHLLVLKDLMRLHDLEAAKPAVIERVRTAPPIPPATRQAQGSRPSAIARANERLRREGSVEAAAAALPDSWF